MLDVNEFLDSLAPHGGNGDNEAVCEALKQACERMTWGAHSFRVMCLVGDAAPHTDQDDDTKFIRRKGLFVDSEFFGRPFEDNVTRVRAILEEHRVHLFTMGVGKNASMKSMFPRLVRDPDNFLSLLDDQEFIRALESELSSSRSDHNQAVELLRMASSPSTRLSDLDDNVYLTLNDFGIDPETLKAMRGEMIQTGWFTPKMGDDAAVCVYMRRDDLENWGVQLRLDLKEGAVGFKQNQTRVLEGIAGKHLGPIKSTGIGNLMKVFDDVAYTPEILRLQNLGMDDAIKVRQLRKKLNNIEIMMLMDNLFSEHEEGWVPMEYLPGSLSDLKKIQR
jgi:hypothetical protein